MTETSSQIKEFRDIVRIGKECIPFQGPLRVNHTGRNNALFGEYLASVGGDYDVIRRVVDSGGYLAIKPSNITFQDLDRLGPEGAEDAIYEIVEPTYDSATKSLDGIYEAGFNVHDGEHALRNGEKVGELLSTIKEFPIEKLVNARVGSALHDIGNPFSRKAHSIAGARLARILFPKLAREPQRFGRILNSIRYHTEEVVGPALEYRSHLEGVTTFEQRARVLGKIVTPEGLANIIADKVDVGKKRVSPKPTDIAFIDRDMHLAVNLLGETTGLRHDQSRNKLEWNLDFTPGLSSGEALAYFSRRKNGVPNFRAYVPQIFHERHDDEQLPANHFDSWKQLFMTLYFGRIELTALAAFALFEKLEEFEIRIQDCETFETFSVPFTRGRVDQQLVTLKKKYQVREKRKNGK
jgi:hypothetical protein